VDWEAATVNVHERHGGPNTPDFEDALDMAQVCCDTWGQPDYEACLQGDAVIEGIETPFRIPGLSKGTRDLVIRYSDGSFLIRDWKSAWNLEDPKKLARWRWRLEVSWQAPIYASSLGIPASDVSFVFCGVSRYGTTQQVVRRFTSKDFIVTGDFLANTKTAMSVMHRGQTLPAWPKNMPQACGAYGRDCPWIAECPKGNDPPSGDVQLVDDELRYSYATLFWLCPERYRRTRLEELAGEVTDPTEPPLVGSLLHTYMEFVYQRVKELTV
jgi:hypothetical protein